MTPVPFERLEGTTSTKESKRETSREISVGLNYKQRLSRRPKNALLHRNQVAKSSGVP